MPIWSRRSPFRSHWGLLLAGLLGGSGILGLQAIVPPLGNTIQLADGTVFFERPPSLQGATTTRNEVYASRPVYYFTLDVPIDAGEPLDRVQITQSNFTSGTGQVRYTVARSTAFLGTPRRRGDRVALGMVEFNQEDSSIQVEFDPPVDPGQVITLALRPQRNPRLGGVYLFGVTAFPPGEKVHGQFLGYGRLHFYERRDFFDRGFFP